METSKEDNSLLITDNLKEYNDQEDRQDSLSQKMDKMYQEENKEKRQKLNRPISSYHKNENPLQARDLKEDQVGKKVINIPKKAELPSKTFEELSKELSQHLISNKVSKSAFVGSVNAFYTIDDFKELLASFRYNLPNKYLKVLFENEGIGIDGGFLNIKKFAERIKFYESDELIDVSLNNSYKLTTNSNINNKDILNNNNNLPGIGIYGKDKNTEESFTNSKSSNFDLKNETKNTLSDNRTQTNTLNEEFSKFNKDIYQILKNDAISSNYKNKGQKIPKKLNRVQSAVNYFPNKFLNDKNQFKNISDFRDSSQNIVNKIPFLPLSKDQDNLPNIDNINNILYNNFGCDDSNTLEMNMENNNQNNLSNLNYSIKESLGGKNKKYLAVKNIMEKQRKAQIEDEKIRINFRRENEKYISDCIIKVNEINRFCYEMGITKHYELNENNDSCNVYENNVLIDNITLKGVLIQWRLLKANYLKKFHRDNEVNNNNKFNANKDEGNTNIEKLLRQKEEEKNERLKEVKDVLINTVKLKTKLKTQLENLQRKIVVDKNIIVEYLKRNGVEFPADMTTQKKMIDKIEESGKFTFNTVSVNEDEKDNTNETGNANDNIEVNKSSSDSIGSGSAA